jgi:hypothetical protein
MKLVREKRDDKDSTCKTDRERETKSFASLTQSSSSAGISICGYFCRKMTAPAMKRAAAE